MSQPEQTRKGGSGIDIKLGRELLERATPRPWATALSQGRYWNVRGLPMPGVPRSRGAVCNLPQTYSPGGSLATIANASLIAFAVNALPELLNAYEEREQQRKEDDYSASVDSEIVHKLRQTAKEVTGGNCTFADDDLMVLAHLARRAIQADLLDGLAPSVAASCREPSKEPNMPGDPPACDLCEATYAHRHEVWRNHYGEEIAVIVSTEGDPNAEVKDAETGEMIFPAKKAPLRAIPGGLPND